MNIQSLLQVDLFLQVSDITPGRAAAILPAVVGLISVVIGWLALARSAGRTGSGRLKAIVALVLGLIGMVLGELALARYRRIARRSSTTATASSKERT